MKAHSLTETWRLTVHRTSEHVPKASARININSHINLQMVEFRVI